MVFNFAAGMIEKKPLGNETVYITENGVAKCCELHTKMNALNTELIDFMHKSLDYVDKNGAGLIIGNQAGGMPGAFSDGADLKEITRAVEAKQVDAIDKMIDSLQQAIQRERYSHFPVVAAPYGMALGGGCEVCLGADRIVAHSELFMGLVEIGVGVLPAEMKIRDVYAFMRFLVDPSERLVRRVVFCATLISESSALFTASSLGNAAATSGFKTTIFDDSRKRLAYFPRTKPRGKSDGL